MFYISFKVDNPFTDRFANLFNRSGQLSKNKACEFEILKVNSLLNFQLQYNTRTDHAGLHFELGLFGYEFRFGVYDTRHWDYKNHCWEVHT